MGDRTAPGAGLNLSVAKVGLPDIGKVAMANGCVLVRAARPLVDASVRTAAQLAPSRRSCPSLMVAA